MQSADNPGPSTQFGYAVGEPFYRGDFTYRYKSQGIAKCNLYDMWEQKDGKVIRFLLYMPT
jgi:hypothetical protein